MFNEFNIGLTIKKLGIEDFVLRGEPTNEVEFKKMFRKVVGKTDDGSAIESDNPSDFGVTWDQIVAKQAELQAEYDSKQYQRDRAVAYPSTADQLDMLYHQGIDGWKAEIKKVKDQFPKPE